MEIMNKTCGACSGNGVYVECKLVPISSNESTITSTWQEREVKCEACNGKGYIEYAAFSIEEAEAILKHCGLSKEI